MWGGRRGRTMSDGGGGSPCRYWQLREPPRPRLRSGTPPNLGGECPHSNSFTAPMSAGNPLCIVGGHRPTLQINCAGYKLRTTPTELGGKAGRRCSLWIWTGARVADAVAIAMEL